MTVSQQDLFKQYPFRRIKPYDGMVVTSEVWDEAHTYHRQQERYHNLLNHEPGILIGLEVIASDPPDSAVYVQPGIALDAAGQVIVLPDALAFDLGAAQGTLYLALSYDESQPKADEIGTPVEDASDVKLMVHAQYGLEAVGTPPDPASMYVELARINRQGAEAPITNPDYWVQPAPNQIDLRFRRNVGVAAQPAARLAVCYVGQASQDEARRHGVGANVLARTLRRDRQAVWVDDAVALGDSDLNVYTLVYLVAQGEFQLTPDEMNSLYIYLRSGGTVLIESCRKAAASANADPIFLDMLASFGTTVAAPPADHPLLSEPNFFAAPPVGFETDGLPALKVGEGVIVSAWDYGCLWQGERRGRAASREEIRAARNRIRHEIAAPFVRRAQANRAR